MGNCNYPKLKEMGNLVYPNSKIMGNLNYPFLKKVGNLVYPDRVKNGELSLPWTINAQYEEKYTIGNKISDIVAKFGGSWRFIISFFSILILWILVNSHLLLSKPFDPYPYILLNLILSCIAAIQAPIIMMSQNRLETKDRIRVENDYKINLKSEIEIRTLHEKIDHLLLEQWSKMIEIQELQIDLLNEIRESIEKKHKYPNDAQH